VESVGIDVGSTTAKVVVVRDRFVVHRAYLRHRGDPRGAVRTLLEASSAHAERDAPRSVTGSAGSALAASLDASYVHEVHAVATAVRLHLPRAKTVVELGGQDAKMIHLQADGGLSSEMNERCAAGTGATLDRCRYRLGLDEAVLASLAVPEGDLPVVSAKCGVFAETDLVNLIKTGVPLERALAAMLDAVVRGNLAVLARGRPLPPQVALLGGPHAFIPSLAALWRRHLIARWREYGVDHGASDDVVVAPHAEFFAAEGAVLASTMRTARLVRPRRAEPERRDAIASRAEVRRILPSPRAPSHGSDVGLALGIDAGSTTIKAVVLDAQDLLVAKVYRRADRGPLEDAREVLMAVARELGADASNVTSFGVTGYGADALGPVLGADAAPVETLAHARSALHFAADVDVVCDIGGQDIKVLLLDRGSVTRFHLSNQCAAGNGALLESTARDLGVPIERFAEVAASARRVPEMNVGCAVFLDTERVTCQRDGYSPGEILAGMASVLARNVWENVVAAPSIAALGRRFMLSGGVQQNAAAVTAQADYLRRRHPEVDIMVHPFPGEAGAIGAALAGRDAAAHRPSRFVGLPRAVGLTFAVRQDETTRCRRCPSACARTFVVASGGDSPQGEVATGHGCDRGAEIHDVRAPRETAASGKARARNLVRLEAERLFARATNVRVATHAGRGLRVGIPRVLSMFRSAPLFTHYLEAIGVPRDHIVTGGWTRESLFTQHAGRGVVDACFPAKVVQAHIAALLADRARAPFDVLFFPVLTHAVTAVAGTADTASCPVVAGTPFVTRAAFELSGALPRDVVLLTPTLRLTQPERFEADLFEAIRSVAPALGAAEHRAAVAEGRAAQRAFELGLERAGAAALAGAAAERRVAIVMLGRPYHADPGLHHDIGSELRSLGRTVLSLRALPKDPGMLTAAGCDASFDAGPGRASLTNSGDGEKLAAARVVGAHPYLAAIEVSSFKCGQDASLYGAVERLARRGGRPFLALHDLDETRPVGSLRLRLRTFLDAVERYEARTRMDAP